MSALFRVGNAPAPVADVEKTVNHLTVHNYGTINSGANVDARGQRIVVSFWKYRAEGFIAGLVTTAAVELVKYLIDLVLKVKP